jgi:flagellar biosynthetic protein FliR
MIGFNEAQIMAWVTPIFWPFLRILALFSSAPVLSARSFTTRTRVILALFIAICAQAGIPEQAFISLNDARALGTTIEQVVIGVAIGLAARVVLSSVEMAGEVIGLQMGLNFAGFFDPATSSQSSAVGRFFGNTTMLLMLVMNGHLILIQAVISSFETFPIGYGTLQVIGQMKLHQLGSIVFSYGLWISLPMVGILMFVNIVLGFVSRVAPQMNAFAIGFPLTLSVGLIGLAFTLPMLGQPIMVLIKLVADMFSRH